MARKKSSDALIDKDKSDIISELHERQTVYTDSAKMYHPLWYLCFLRVHGQHYSEFAPDMWRYRKSDPYVEAKRAPRPKVDKTARAIDDIVSYLTDGFPSIRVFPNSDNPNDEAIFAAKKLDPFILYEQSQDRLNEVDNIEEEVMWTLVTGNYFRQGILTDSDEPIPYINEVDVPENTTIPIKKCRQCGMMNESEAMQCSQCGSGELYDDYKEETVYKKDIRRNDSGEPLLTMKPGKKLGIRGIAPFQMFPNNRAKNLETCPDWFVITMENVDFIKAKYGKEIPESHSQEGLYDWQKMLNEMVPDIYGDSLYFQDMPDVYSKGRVPLIEYYRRPIKGLDDEGAYIIYTEGSNEPLHVGKYPYINSPTGLVQFGWRKTARFWYGGLAEMIFPINDHINSVWSQLAAIRKRMLPKWVNPTDSGVSSEDLAGDNFVINVDTKEQAPDILIPKGTYIDTAAMLSTLYLDFDQMSAWNDALKGVSPKNVRTSSGLQMMLEQASAPFKKKVKNYVNTKKRQWGFMVWMVQHLMDTNQILKTSDEIGKDIIRVADIQGSMKISIDVSVQYPKSRAVQQSKISELMNYGMGDFIKQSPHTFNQLLETMDLSPESFNPMFDVHHKRATYENILMRRGQPAQLDQWDNNEIHLWDHETLYFNDDVQFNQELKQLVGKHIAEHQQLLAQNKTMQQPPIQQGAPPLNQNTPPPQGG